MFTSLSPGSVHASVWFALCTSALLKSAPLRIRTDAILMPMVVLINCHLLLCHTVRCLGWKRTCPQCYNADTKGHLWIP